MSQKGLSDLNNLLEGLTSNIEKFEGAIKDSSIQLENFSKSIDKKVLSLGEEISTLTTVIKQEDKTLTENLGKIFTELKEEIISFKAEVQIEELQETLESLKKLVKIPEKHIINKNVEKVVKEIFEITRELKKQEMKVKT